MVDITNILENATVDLLFRFKEESPNLIRLNRNNFADIIKAADRQGQLKDAEIDMYLRMLSDEDFISIIVPAIEKGQFQWIKEENYSLLVEDYKSSKKKDYLFISEKHLTRLLIKTYIRYEWILKAMAIDYAKYLDGDLMETYKEYFESNNRIIELILLEGYYDESANRWKIDWEHNTLIYSFGKKEVIWTKGEAENRFEELI
ncbi:hypothetical protein [Alkalibaculum bacchi]|jgi:hypothetical protein|uniref:hypothetical protein n=1 Tax=Alkalibaculum bacchi TaxID=645887 RepID=UPI0026EAB08D|nr:hypothetical protein [Alkalibaculum bacchi]